MLPEGIMEEEAITVQEWVDPIIMVPILLKLKNLIQIIFKEEQLDPDGHRQGVDPEVDQEGLVLGNNLSSHLKESLCSLIS